VTLSPIEAGLLVAALALPFHLLVQWQLSRLSDPGYLRARGVVILDERVLQQRGSIGEFKGRKIPESVVFLGMAYRYDRVIAPAQKDELAAGELYLEPGLVYVTD
jgi:hypothetical protein